MARAGVASIDTGHDAGPRACCRDRCLRNTNSIAQPNPERAAKPDANAITDCDPRTDGNDEPQPRPDPIAHSKLIPQG